MPIPTHVDIPVKVIQTIKYVSTTKHRVFRGNSAASLWTINMKEEYIAFLRTKPNKNPRQTIGAHIVQNAIQPLGKLGSYNNLFFAKFENDINSGIQWHGYPIDYRASTDYRPSQGYLNYLVKKQIITKAKKKKIIKGKPL